MKKNCEICRKSFEKKVNESRRFWSKRRFCSVSCALKEPQRQKKKGETLRKLYDSGKIQIWNKGKVGLQVAWNKGNGEYAKKLGFGKWMQGKDLREKSGNWKGDSVGYTALHDWVRRRLGTPSECSHCGLVSKNRNMMHWANKSRKYKRDLTDWVRLCAKCHKLFDKGNKQKVF